MGAFTPFKRRANQFKYIPRYYDPAAEAREQRRAELLGVSKSNTNGDDGEYHPGKYIKTQSEARSARRSNSRLGSRMKMWISVGVIVVLTLLGSMLYTKITEAFGLTEGSTTGRKAPTAEYEEFNPYAPITVVPNDYDASTEENKKK